MANLSSGENQAVATFYPCRRNLVVALRELAQLERQDDAFTIDSDEKLAQRYRTDELSRLYLDGVFVQLRRLADRFAAAYRVLLFSKHGVASPQFKKLRRAILDAKALAKMNPKGDIVSLQAAFRDHTRWFDELRNEGPSEGLEPACEADGGSDRVAASRSGFCGIRDQMEHRCVDLLIGGHRANEGPVVRTAYLTRPSGGIDAERELFDLLRVILSDLCEFLAGVHTAIGFGETYERLDNFLVFGTDADIVHWWPAL